MVLAGTVQAQPTVSRVSLQPRADGKGYVVRIHTDERIPEQNYTVDLVDESLVQVMLENVRLSRRFRQDEAAGPVVDYTVRQRVNRVEIRFRLDETTPVNVVYYPDGASTDFLVALNYAAPAPPSVADASADQGPADPVEQERQEAETPDERPTAQAEVEPEAVTDASNGTEHDAAGDQGAATPVEEEKGPDAAEASTDSETGESNAEPGANEDGSPMVAERVQLPEGTVIKAPAPSEQGPNAEPWRLNRIVIDAGHGGHDSGASANGVREKDIALAIALKLGKHVEEKLGVEVVYTRTDDRFVDLYDRGKIANEAGAKLFVSIHVNSVGGRRARVAQGTETFFLGLHKTESARHVMERENSVIQLENDPERYAAYHDGGLVLQTLAQTAFLEQSELLAGMIEREFRDRVKRVDRGVKQAGLIVLWRASMPAVLVETGFITNPDEAKFLTSERGQELMASAIFRAIRDYKEQYERGLGISASQTSE